MSLPLLLPAPRPKRGRKPKARDVPLYPVLVEDVARALPTRRSRGLSFRIEVHRVEEPSLGDLEHELAWLCASIGFSRPSKPSEKAAFSVFREVMAATEQNAPVSSTLLARRLRMSRGAVIHYLNQLLASGLIVKSRTYYFVRSKSLETTIAQVEAEIEDVFKRMKQIAAKIDREFDSDSPHD